MRYEDSRQTHGVIPAREATPPLEQELLTRAAELQATAPGDAEGARPLLDIRTQLALPQGYRNQNYGWKFTFWPGCGEASVCIVTSGATRYRPGERHREKTDVEMTLNWQIANGRAGTRSRRYFVSVGNARKLNTFDGEKWTPENGG